MYADFRKGEQFCMIPEQNILNKFADPTTNETLWDLNGDCFTKFGSDMPERGSDRYNVEVVESWDIERLENPIVGKSSEEEQKKQCKKNGNWFDSIEDDDIADSSANSNSVNLKLVETILRSSVFRSHLCYITSYPSKSSRDYFEKIELAKLGLLITCRTFSIFCSTDSSKNRKTPRETSESSALKTLVKRRSEEE